MTLFCKANGLPKPVVTWRKAFSHMLGENAAIIDGNLTIFNVTKQDSGAYACSATNILGKDSATALLTVTDRLKFTLTPPLKIIASEFGNVKVELRSSRK